MFAQPRAKSTFPPPSKKRKLTPMIEEINFDTSAREDYLTGFHKRKLQRIKHAKTEAAKKEREGKLNARKQLRDSRKTDLEKHVQAMNSILREQGNVTSDASGEDNIAGGKQWEGIAEEPTVDHEHEYHDDDRFTTVTVEAVDVSKDGLHKSPQNDNVSSNAISPDGPQEDLRGLSAGEVQPGSRTKKRTWSKESPNKPKKKKKKFRYGSKAERKITRFKERSGNNTKAKARKTQ